MTMRVTGLTSGLDTESIISALVSAYEAKTQKYTKAQTKLTWTQDAWKSLNTKVYSLYTNVSNLRFSSAYTTKKATVSDSTKASVTASGSAVTGTQTLSVNSVAASGYMTGAKIETVKETNRDETDTKLSELGYTGGKTSFDVKVGGKTVKTIELTQATKISDIVSSLKEAGLNANFDTNQGRFYISSKTTGTASDFEFVPSTTSQNDNGTSVHNPQDAFDALYSLGLATQKMLDDNTEITKTGRKSSDMRIEYKGSGAAAGSSVETAMNIKFEAPTSKDQADAQNALVKAVNSDNVSVSVKEDDVTGEKVAEFSLKGYVIEDSGETFESDGQTYKTLNIYKADANGNKTGDVVATGYTTRNNISDNVTAGETINSLKVTASGGSTASYEFANKIDGSDSSITLNGVEYTGTTNSFSINGLSINALAKTDGDITITTTTDTQAIYDKIKDFLTEYNSVINEMTKLYNADSSYGYDPLTDDEKDAMSDTEIEKWETKIKDSLLRNDTTLNGVMMAMINSMSTAYTINGQKYSLSTFGIGTLGYLNAVENENYAYHIDGDSDDDNTSSKDDKLMTAITEDPDTVIEFMKQLTSGLYTSLGNKMKSTTLSSAYTIYNDKEMNSQYSEYSKTISKWEDKLSDKEDYYYNKFSKMESALTTLQSQSSAVSGLFSS